ncbi:MAG: hypothetical protein PF439_10605 [Helicobacteraceae bacterium]|jgi:hypothetical protein|nr:hypothetical protein [Helicobacteraceae bacterium]
MKEFTLKEYAVKNKISLFNVMKLAKSGQIPSETRTVNGKEEIVILTDEAPKPAPVIQEQNIDYKKAYFELKAKYDKLVKQKG